MENPEVLLKRRRNADQTRLAKQALAQQRKNTKRVKKNKFVRPESLVAKTLATTREKERIRRVSKTRGEGSEFILRVRGGDSKEDGSEGEMQTEKVAYDGKPQLLLVVRVRGPTAVNIPHKAYKVLQVLRLVHLNQGVFFRLTAQTFDLLRIVAPYVVVGEPSLSCVRSLVQKRGRVTWNGKQDVLLNDNTMVEEALGEHGIICIEDVVHEIASLGPAFKQCCFFLKPFQLSRQVSGFGALQKLKKLELREQDGERQLSNAAAAPIIEVDIDELVAKMN
ncbi:RLP7 (YNL002C) [Zygosaccharomyces parabailii]|uniref:Ribosome biogenesis protein RLP7 n=1 Tax=Zygosaccharomyces bailii (strain CLIB 213 / ATCC 58445 / CBS 680 / BCRC 21525 / NBRC 1098 / NCYC 1416 / NRRL Y-2227) TaxID=1333698 RepID=A0A8J2T867_ZYGB2|nr:RLP7 (YNL002C) [Zygosaccharomyces parabailii]CDF90136.1 ZYBA0S06-01442g1_1 [Zygosaccharomyces bailii CLIB 213]